MSWRAFFVLLLVAAAAGAAVGRLPSSDASDSGPTPEPTAAEPAGITADEAPVGAVTPEPAPEPESYSLTIGLRDERSGAAARSWIRLWRLGVGADEEWTAGDRMVLQVQVLPEGADVGRLPAGRYRVHVLGACEGAEDPPEFRLERDVAHVLATRLPRTFPAHVEVLDEMGSRIEEATLGEVGFACTRHGGDGTPSWARASQRYDGEDPLAFGMSVGCRQASEKIREIRAGPEGLPLGDVTEASRTRSGGRWAALSFPGRSAVHVRVVDSNAGRGRYFAVAVPLDPLASHVLLPDGMPAVAAGATVTAVCRAEFVAGEDPVPDGIDLPIEVTVRLEGFRTRRFERRVGDRPAELLLMEPRDRSALPRDR